MQVFRFESAYFYRDVIHLINALSYYSNWICYKLILIRVTYDIKGR